MAKATKLKIGNTEKILAVSDSNGVLQGEIPWSQVTSKPTIPTKIGMIDIIGNSSGTNGTMWLRSNWTCQVKYIGDTSNGGYGVLVGSVQCNVLETLGAVTLNTIYGFAPMQTASIRMVGYAATTSEDMWYGASGSNNLIFTNNSGSNRTYTQWSGNTFAIPVQKKY